MTLPHTYTRPGASYRLTRKAAEEGIPRYQCRDTYSDINHTFRSAQMNLGGGAGPGGAGDGGIGTSEMANISDLYDLDALEARRAREEEIRLLDLQRTTRQAENDVSHLDDPRPNAADPNPNPNPDTSFPDNSTSAASNHVHRPTQLLSALPSQAAAPAPSPPPKDLSFDTPDTPNRFLLGGFYAHTQTAKSGYTRWNQPVHESEYPISTSSPNKESNTSSSSYKTAMHTTGSKQPFDRNFNTLPAANPDQPLHPFGQFGTPYALSSVWSDADADPSFHSATSCMGSSSASDFTSIQRHPGPLPGGIVYPTPPESVNESPLAHNVAYGGSYSSSSASLGFGSSVRSPGGRAAQGDVGQGGAANPGGILAGGTGKDTRLMNPEDWNRLQQQEERERERQRQRSNQGSVGHHNPQSQGDGNSNEQNQGGDESYPVALDLHLYHRLLAGGAGENAAPSFCIGALNHQSQLEQRQPQYQEQYQQHALQSF